VRVTIQGAVALTLVAVLASAEATGNESGVGDVARLRPDLTLFGAESAGKSDGSIPDWTGGLSTPPPGYGGDGEVHPDPFADDQPLFIIDANNLEQHRTLLSDGLVAMLARYPASFTMPVYPSRRSHAAPEWVYQNTSANLTRAQLVEQGNGFVGAYGGIPFPMPDEALQVYWNHVARWRGQYIESRGVDVNVYADGKYVETSRYSRIKFNYYEPNGSPDTVENRLFSLLSRVTSPPQKAGNAVLVLETIDQDAESRSAWAWDAGRRRALRAPQVAFDTAVNAADGLRTADDTDLINGSPSRFHWSLKGKREMIIPYNNYRLASQPASPELLQPGHIDPQMLRYERHRVWVLEGRLKDEWRHVYSRRVLYIDEDSWMAVVAEMYDRQGELWRVAMAYPMNHYELPATLPVAFAYHDLPSGRYHVVGLAREGFEAPRTQLDVPANGQFTPSGLRRFAR
jgi:hypothetical protein